MSDEAPASRSEPVALPVLTIAQHQFVRMTLPLVDRRAAQIARRAYGRADVDDLATVGKLALYRAVRTFNERFNHSFEAYADRRVQSAMWAAVRAEDRQTEIKIASERAALHFGAYYRDDFNIFVHDDEALAKRHQVFAASLAEAAFLGGIAAARKIPPDEEAVAREEWQRAIDVVRAALAKVPEKERAVLELVYDELKTLDEAAEALGIPYSTAWDRHTRALGRLRSALGVHGFRSAPRFLEGSNVVALFPAPGRGPVSPQGPPGTGDPRRPRGR